MHTFAPAGQLTVVVHSACPATENLRPILIQILIDLKKLYQIVFNCYMMREYQSEAINELSRKIIHSLREYEKFWQEAKKEKTRESWVNETWEFLVIRLWQHVSTMKHVALDRREDTIWHGLAPQLTELAQVTSISFGKLVEAVAAKHPSPVLPDLELAFLAVTEQL